MKIMTDSSENAEPGTWFNGVECGRCGKSLWPRDFSEPTGGEFRVVCGKCGNDQIYRLSDLKWLEAQQ